MAGCLPGFDKGAEFMPDETTNQTPNNAGTGDQTPASGTVGQTAATTASSPPPAEDYKTKFTESSKEAQRLYQENVRLQQMLAHTVNQARAQQPVTQQQPQEFDYGIVTDGVLDRDPSKLRLWEDKVIARAEHRIEERARTESARNFRLQSSIRVIEDVFKNPQSPIAQQAVQRYQQIITDPSYSFVTDDEIDVPGAAGVRINPHKMRIAINETQAAMVNKVANLDNQIREGSEQIEGASTDPKKSSDKKPDLNKLLSDQEKRSCDVTNISYDEFWKYMDDDVKAVRMKYHRPVMRDEIRRGVTG